jgi:predicted helicase
MKYSRYDYIVNGKSAIEWAMERYAVAIHKESIITNIPNDWAIKRDNPRYIRNCQFFPLA